MRKTIVVFLTSLAFIAAPNPAITAASGNQITLQNAINAKIKGIVRVNTNFFACEMLIWDASSPKSPTKIQDAKITLNDSTIPWCGTIYRGIVHCSTSIGTKAILKIWLNKNGQHIAQRQPDYILQQTVTNKLTLSSPLTKNNESILTWPQTFRWTFAGATEKVCVSLKNHNGIALKIEKSCFTGLEYTVPNGLLSPNQSYILHLETCFREMNFNRTPAPDSLVVFAQELDANFKTQTTMH